jgi:hypothetical protein
MTPKQLMKLTEDEIETLNLSYRLYERRWLESLSDLIGSLTGTSWSVDSLTAPPVNTDLEDYSFTWKKRPERLRVSLPLTLLMRDKVLEHVKKVAFDMKSKERKDPSILSLPSSSMLKNTEIVDLSRVPKEEFIMFARKIKVKG